MTQKEVTYYGLVDCNNFFVSCERVFRPDLYGKPVVVLSNNDGCAVALSEEAKVLGITRGVPLFKIREMAERNGVVFFSGNHVLYGDMSRRVMSTIAMMVDEMEVSSIDEAFIKMPVSQSALHEYGRAMVRRIGRDTGIPVSIGVARTRTLAKLAARFAKKVRGYKGACVIDTDEKARKAMELTPVGDVWGIGRSHAKTLLLHGIKTAAEFADLDESRVRSMFGVTGVRTWRELHGDVCVETEEVPLQRKSFTSSRSFAHDIYEIDELHEAVSAFTSIVGRKLREHGGYAGAVTVYVATNRFHENDPQYFNSAKIILPEPSDDTMTLSGAARRGLEQVFRKGYGYKKAGVMLTDVVGREERQPSLFTNQEDAERRSRLMSVVDKINRGDIRSKVRVASACSIAEKMKSEHVSPMYSTRLSDVITIKV